MPALVNLAVAQAHTLSSTAETVRELEGTTRKAARAGAHLILFPEAYLGGYPRTATFGASVGSRDPSGREQFLEYWKACVDLGDTPLGAGDDWVEKKLPLPKEGGRRGDGVREEVERIARDTGVFVVTGVVEKCGGSLYCAVLYVCPQRGCVGKRRKVMPTGSERLVWAQGSPSTLKAITTTLNGVKITLAAAICWENYMPLLRMSLYSQNVNLYLAPTADARDTWLPLMRTVASESRAFVLSANQCVKRKHLPPWIRGGSPGVADQPDGTDMSATVQPKGRRRSTFSKTEEGHEVCWPTSPGGNVDSRGRGAIEGSETNGGGMEIPLTKPDTPTKTTSVISTGARKDDEEFVSRGGSCIIAPMGDVVAGPLWEVEEGGLLMVTADFEDCYKGRLDLDVAGSYSRNDAFRLHVEGLDLAPPP